MKILAIVMAGAALSLAGCADPVKDAEREAQQAVADQTLDPSSAQFRDVKMVKQLDGSFAFCGEVNAKNAHGGYSGFQPFAYVAHRPIIQGDGIDAVWKITRHCVMAEKSDEEFQAYLATVEQEHPALAGNLSY